MIYRLDPNTFRLWHGDKSERLTPSQFRLAHILMDKPDYVRTRDQILGYVGRENYDVSDRSIDTLMKTLRQKTKSISGSNPFCAVYGIGYVFVGEAGIVAKVDCDRFEFK